MYVTAMNDEYREIEKKVSNTVLMGVRMFLRTYEAFNLLKAAKAIATTIENGTNNMLQF